MNTLTCSSSARLLGFINTFNIRLFLLASAIKPINNAVAIFKERNAVLKAAMGQPGEPEASRLARKLRQLEAELAALRREAATKVELGDLRADLGGEGKLGDLDKAVRRQERRGELVRLTLSEVSALCVCCGART